MSFQSTGWVIDHSPTYGTDRLVLLVLANYGAEHPIERDGVLCWEAWPSIERISYEAGLSKADTTRKALRRLEAGGHIQVIENGCPDERFPANKRPNLYRILTTNPRRCWGGCRLCDPPPAGGPHRGGAATADPPPGGPTDPPPGGPVTPHGEGAKQVVEQVAQQPTKEGPDQSGPSLKARNRAALDKLPKNVDPADVQRLCLALRERIHRHRPGDGPPTVGPNWVSEMGRLLNSGPQGIDDFVPTPGQVHAMIDAIFDHLAEPKGSSDFCWANVVMSPGNLRKKWARITADLSSVKNRGRTDETIAEAVGDLRRMLGG